MSFTTRTQPLSSRAQSLAARTQAKISDLNQGDGVRTARPSTGELRQLIAVLGGTVLFVLIVLSLGILGIMAR